MIRSDIRSRNLRPGDRYLTTEEVAERMEVAKGTANRAMQELARENVLIRNRKLGTFVGDAIAPDPASIDLVCLLVRRSYYMNERHRLNEVLSGVLSVLGQASVQLSLAPDDHEMMFAERLVRTNRTNAFKVGYLIASKSSQVQSFFNQENLPALVMGTPFPHGERMPSIDLDQEAIGREIFRAALATGRRRFAVILRDRRGFGDDLMLNAITAEAMREGLSAGDLIVRSVPSDPELAVGSVQHLLSMPDRPDAIICRSRVLLTAAREAVRAAGYKPMQAPLLFSTDQLPVEDQAGVSASIAPAVTAAEQGRRMGEMLSAIMAGIEPDPVHVAIDVLLKDHSQADKR
jgi:DNA-binding LacI/PurR family transcriptional regulator